jgi:hypothetical protein
VANHDLTSYIVTFLAPYAFGTTDVERMQFWAEDAGHAGEQMDDAEPSCEVVLVETQKEHETRTGVRLDY